mmetsp:Transcript_5979/g.9071  ORF Transcript_5979/g.9071 Transcript_5979/m.9071 type:complete len:82 (-) Transcript_5979:143-388(-)
MLHTAIGVHFQVHACAPFEADNLFLSFQHRKKINTTWFHPTHTTWSFTSTPSLGVFHIPLMDSLFVSLIDYHLRNVILLHR